VRRFPFNEMFASKRRTSGPQTTAVEDVVRAKQQNHHKESRARRIEE
jgi:hypothetical protein